MPDALAKAEPRRSSARAIVRHILVCAPKGGVGKTTISRSLLVCGAHAGLKVHGVDLDPQRGLLNWAERREASRQLLPDIDVAGLDHKADVVGLEQPNLVVT